MNAHTKLLALLLATSAFLLGSPPAHAQSVARLSLDALQDAPVGGTLRLDVAARRLQVTRSVEVQLVTPSGAVRWDSVGVGEGAAGMVVLDWRQRGDTLSVVMSYLSRPAFTTLLRTSPILHLHGTRLLAGGITFSLLAPPISVVSRDGGVQPVELGDAVVTAVEAAGEALTASYGVWPNPTRETALLGFETATPAEATVEIYDVTGRRVGQQVIAVCSGRQQVALPVAGLAPGLYLYRLRLAGAPGAQVFHGRFTLVR